VHLDAVEHDDHLVFMHAVKAGPANRSFGLQVAALAGLPKTVITHAKQRLADLEQKLTHHSNTIIDTEYQTSKKSTPQMELFSISPPVLASLQAINPDELTPKQALEALYQLRAML